MICVAVDSNVYISALLFGGNPRLALECADAGLFGISVSAAIKTKIERVLAERSSWSRDRIAEAASRLWSLANSVSPQQTLTDCADADDNRILECALEAHAAVIVTGDGHLLKLHPYRGIAILTPKRFLESKPWETA